MSFKFHFLFPALLLLAGAEQLLAAVSISSFTPTFGSSTDQNYVSIFGTGFSPGTVVVKFNGVPATTAAAISSTQIDAGVPSGATNGPGPIYVQVGANPANSAYSSQDFTVVGPGPYVSGFSPGSGSDGIQVIVSGEHFTGATNVSFNGKAGSALFVLSDTSLQINTPSGVTTGPITVTRTNISYTTTSNFFVPPVIKGFSPITGRAGTNVLLTGTNFVGTTAVRFGGVNATVINVLSNGAVLVSVPASALTGVIRLDAPAGFFQTTSNFVVQPTIFGFSPPSGPVGTSVMVTGANFIMGSSTVKFNGVTAAAPSGVTFGQLTAIVPAGATTGPISVTTTDGASTSASNFYLPASVTTFSPSNSAPGTTVMITGVNFSNATAVSFNGAPGSFTVTNNTIIGAIVPAGVSTGPISVTTPAGTTTSAGLFYGAPIISGFAPTHVLPGTNVTITGTNFLGATAVRFNGLNGVINSINNGQITASVPVGATTGPIAVVAPAGTNTSASNFVLDYSSDLSLALADAPDPVFVGSNLVYTIVIANNGPFNAPNVKLTNTLPSSVNLKSATTTQGSLATNGNPIIGALGTLANGGTVTVTLTVAPQMVGTITNTASAGSDYQDPAPANNTASTTTTVLPLPLLSIRWLPPNRVEVSWPVALSNYALQFKNTLATNGGWSSATSAPVISGNERVVTETNPGPRRFYRLKD